MFGDERSDAPIQHRYHYFIVGRFHVPAIYFHCVVVAVSVPYVPESSEILSSSNYSLIRFVSSESPTFTAPNRSFGYMDPDSTPIPAK